MTHYITVSNEVTPPTTCVSFGGAEKQRCKFRMRAVPRHTTCESITNLCPFLHSTTHDG